MEELVSAEDLEAIRIHSLPDFVQGQLWHHVNSVQSPKVYPHTYRILHARLLFEDADGVWREAVAYHPVNSDCSRKGVELYVRSYQRFRQRFNPGWNPAGTGPHVVVHEEPEVSLREIF